MLLQINHVTGADLHRHRDSLDSYIAAVLAPHLQGRIWMDGAMLAGRFRLAAFGQMTGAECAHHTWDKAALDALVESVVDRVRGHIQLDALTLTLVPARPFRWFREWNLPEARWSNAFTNGPGNIVLAVPPEPDPVYLANLLAHECHHASPDNPIYGLTLETTFTVGQWLKAEGCAEYFGHLLYPDERWWWPDLPRAAEAAYWQMVAPHWDSAVDAVTSPLLMGDKERGIPTFAGYTLGFRAVEAYVGGRPGLPVGDLYGVAPEALIQPYVLHAGG